MVRVGSCFAQVLELVDRGDFGRAVRDLDAERGAKGFRCWDQFVAMLFCQLGSAHSLREICGGLSTALGRVVHLGMKEAPKRSTLAYANGHRPWELYQRVFEQVLGRCQELAVGRRRPFRFKNPLRILDATVIDLCLEVFDWAKFRRTKGAIKLHLQLQDRGCLPCWALVTEGRTHEVRVAQGLTFEPGTIVVMDRGYTDYGLFGRWTQAEVLFVTRMKSNALYEVVHTIRGGENGVQREEWIRLTGAAAKDCPCPLRRITVWDEQQEREIILLLKFLQLKSSWTWSLSNLAAMLRFNLLTYRDLWAWLDDPYGVPIREPPGEQLAFAL